MVLVEILSFTEVGYWHLNGLSSGRKIIVKESALCDSVKIQGQEQINMKAKKTTSEYF